MASRNKIKLSQIVNDYLLSREQEDYDAHVSQQKCMLNGKIGIRRMIRKMGGTNFKSLRLDVVDGVVTFPPDFMSYSKIGFVDTDCNIIAFGRNENLNVSYDVLKDGGGDPLLDSDGNYLTTRTVLDCAAITPNMWADGFCWLNLHWGSEVYNAYGQVGISNQFGTYRVDYDNERIEFSTDMIQDQIILEYLSDPTMIDDPFVDQRMEDAVKSFIYWKNITKKSNVPQIEKQSARSEYFNDRRLANNRIKSFTIYEATKAVKSTNKQVKL